MGISSCSCILSLMLLLLFFFFFFSAQVMYYAQGRPVLKHQELAQDGDGEMVSSMMIGSTPPRCERRCMSCGHCEAVQVPIAPSGRSGTKHFLSIASRSDDTSNYKPMSWKCKCGQRLLNP